MTQKIEDYLDELHRFTIFRKKDSLTDTQSVFNGKFHYSFEEIRDQLYEIDPENIERLEDPIEIKFFHKDDQKRHIANQTKIYSDTPIGLGRLIQRSNLKFFYRSFEKGHTESVAHQT